MLKVYTTVYLTYCLKSDFRLGEAGQEGLVGILNVAKHKTFSALYRTCSKIRSALNYHKLAQSAESCLRRDG
jgi:hypothetical protein